MSINEQTTTLARSLKNLPEILKERLALASEDDFFGTGPGRKDALEGFLKSGLPGSKTERWRQTPLQTKLASENKTGSRHLNRQPDYSGLSPFILNVLPNGTVATTGEQPKGMTWSLFSRADANTAGLLKKHLGKIAAEEMESLTKLNRALVSDGLFLHFTKDFTAKNPVIIQFEENAQETGDDLSFFRQLIVAENPAQCPVIIQQGSPAATLLSNLISEIFVKDNSSLQFYQIHSQNSPGIVYQSNEADLGSNSLLTGGVFHFAGQFVRTNFNVHVSGKHSEANLCGMSCLDGEMLADDHIFINHKAPECTSNQLFRGIFDENSTGVFNGKIIIQPDAQKIAAYQSGKNILLSENATANLLPELEIYADDVKCSHGATCGRHDKEALFYLQSRGLSRDAAFALLNFAFCSEAIEAIPFEPLQAVLLQTLQSRLKIEF